MTLDFHATVLEVVLIAGVGGYIGFLIGLRLGIHLAATSKATGQADNAPAEHPSKAKTGESSSPWAS